MIILVPAVMLMFRYFCVAQDFSSFLPLTYEAAGRKKKLKCVLFRPRIFFILKNRTFFRKKEQKFLSPIFLNEMLKHKSCYMTSVKNPNFFSKLQIFLKNPNFFSKLQIFLKNTIFSQKIQIFSQKIQIFSQKIQIFS